MRSLELRSRRATKDDAKAIAHSIFTGIEEKEGEMILCGGGTTQGEERQDRLVLIDEDSNQIETMVVEEYIECSGRKARIGIEDEDEETSLVCLCGGRDEYEKLMIDIQNELDGERADDMLDLGHACREEPPEEPDWASEMQLRNGQCDVLNAELTCMSEEEEGYENDEDVLVCPYCRTGTMRLSLDSAVCSCGKTIPLRDSGPPPTLLSVYDLKQVLARAYERFAE